MLTHPWRLPLTRRLIAHYLMYGLASIVSLVVGLAVLVHYLDENYDQTTAVAKVREAARIIQDDFIRQGGANVQRLVESIAAQDSLAYCAVLSPDGTCLAHSKRHQIGQKCQALPSGDSSGDAIEHVRVIAADAPVVSAYRTILQHEQAAYGLLEVGLIESSIPDWIQGLFGAFRPAILAPVLILVLGGRFLTRAVRQSAQIESQLCQVSAMPSSTTLPLTPLGEHGPAADGWNRVVERVNERRPAASVQDVLAPALSRFQEQRALKIVNGLPDGIVAEKDGAIIFANRAFCTMFDIPEANASGRTLQSLLDATFRENPAAREALQSHLSRPVVVELRRTENDADGVLRFARHPVSDDDGQGSLAVWSIRDVTQQKLAEEMRNQFVFCATHELRTPLANIKACAETLALHELEDVEKQKYFLNTINSEATRLARFVDELLNVSRMESGGLALERSEVHLERVLSETAAKVRPLMVQKELTFDVILPPKLPELNLDKDKITAALLNLLGNAAKYTPDKGRVTLRVEINSTQLRICVEDTGFGIAPEELPKLFGKFFRSADPRIRDIPGSGLGLAFAQQVVRLHGGTLAVHSELNKGTKFTITLPLG